MQFMMLMIPLGYETAPPDVQLDPERVKSMMKYNQDLKDAGVLIALDGLHPPSMGARVSFHGGKPLVTDGPFAESKEVLGGYWMINVKSPRGDDRLGQEVPGFQKRDHRNPPGAGNVRCFGGGAGRPQRDSKN